MSLASSAEEAADLVSKGRFTDGDRSGPALLPVPYLGANPLFLRPLPGGKPQLAVGSGDKVMLLRS